MDCKDVRENLGALSDGELNAQEKEEILSHIAQCPECMAEYKELIQIKEDFKKLDVKLHSALSESVMEKIRENQVKTKKTPFIFRHMGVAASLIIILSLFFYSRFMPKDNFELSQVPLKNESVTEDSSESEESVYQDEENNVFSDTASDVLFDDVKNESMVISPSLQKPTESDRGDPESEKKESVISFSVIQTKNSLDTDVAIMVVEGEIENVIKLFDAYPTLKNSENCVTVSLESHSVEKILTKNSVPVIRSEIPENSESTALYFN